MKEQLLTTLETSRNYTLAVAEAMPEKNYVFKPADTAWNFGGTAAAYRVWYTMVGRKLYKR
ncbi:MAG: hypothetical protein WDO16_15395 [Bacteroidota bacterium]